MADFADEVWQAKAAWRYYVKGDNSVAYDLRERRWYPVTAAGDDAGDPPAGGLSKRALSRIAKVQDAERRGLMSHDAAEAEILTIIREES